MLQGWAMMAETCPKAECQGMPYLRPPRGLKATTGGDSLLRCTCCALLDKLDDAAPPSPLAPSKPAVEVKSAAKQYVEARYAAAAATTTTATEAPAKKKEASAGTLSAEEQRRKQKARRDEVSSKMGAKLLAAGACWPRRAPSRGLAAQARRS